MWEKVADGQTGLASWFEGPDGGQYFSDLVELGGVDPHRERFTSIGDQSRLGIEGVHLRHPPIHKQKYHMFGFRLEMGLPQGSRRFFNRSDTGLICHQSSQGQLAKPICMSGQPLASRDVIAALIRILLHLYFLSSVSDD